MEVSFVFVVSGIPSRARWLDELGALVGTVMLPRHSRAGQAIALLTGLRPDGCSQAFPFTSKLFQPSDLITAFCELSTQHILFRLGLTVLVHYWSPSTGLTYRAEGGHGYPKNVSILTAVPMFSLSRLGASRQQWLSEVWKPLQRSKIGNKG